MDMLFRLLRVGLTAALLFLPVALGATFLAEPAFPQAGPKGDLGAAPAQPAPNCGPHAEMKEGLLKRHKESRRGLGLISPTAVMEMYFSEAGTWTVLITDISGNSCVASSGTFWIEFKPKIVGPKV